MGWCSGTEIFDDMCEQIFHIDGITENAKILLVKSLTLALEKQDWDCHSDSFYYVVPIVQDVFRQLHPEWFVDDDKQSDEDSLIRFDLSISISPNVSKEQKQQILDFVEIMKNEFGATAKGFEDD